jgi:hypothetical protein
MTDRDPRTNKLVAPRRGDPEASPHRRAGDAAGRERRVGTSRLSTWSGQRVALTWIAWPAIVLALIAFGAAASVRLLKSTEEVRFALSRSNAIGLAAVILVPPACLTLQWWLMHGRRRGRRERASNPPVTIPAHSTDGLDQHDPARDRT